MALTKAQLIDLNGNELILDLDADTATARIQFVGGHDTSDIGASYSFFSGFLAC